MAKSIANRLFGLLLMGFSGGLWAWMLGWLARPLPPESLNGAPMLAAWMKPGVMPFPLIVSIVAGVVGLLYVVGVFPLARTTDDGKTE
ncbi:hypothetical protein AAB990_22590 [Burkholderia contaminans]|uniref:hypothetical protein n=1 Tax=Burkholderia contaminans TaxID=488447 RepID=UPI0024161361|nr:hypothetical protein [Burkholderia contaminans]WFN15827.1 hypothetical protein LXE92_40290 [Burkholderia contaminans]